MKVALMQMHVTRDRSENISKAISFFEDYIPLHPDIDMVLLPEIWTYAFDTSKDVEKQIATYGESLDGELVSRIRGYAKKYGIWINTGSLPIYTSGEKWTNTSILINREGEIVSTYDKMHVCGWSDETLFFEYGKRVVVTPSEFGALGSMICYDIRFPELARSLCLKGAKIILVNSAFGQNPANPKLELWRSLLKARAIENMAYVVACDQCGDGYGSLSYFGHSIIVDPYGRTIAEAGNEEEVLIGELDMQLVEKAREEIPVYEDRKPELYEL